MTNWSRILRCAFVSGTTASIASAAALGLVARLEGKAAVQPLNATSHWLNGPQAADMETIDLTRTGVGYATHHAATTFWAVIFHWWLGRRDDAEPLHVVRDALALSVVAVVADYVFTPKRFTPGWEFVLSRQSMGCAYVAMGFGLAAGALLTANRTP